MNRPPAFQFYPKDWLDFRVQRMSLAAQGAYMKILCFMWKDSQDQCSIIDDDRAIATAIGVPCEIWKDLREEIQFPGDPILQKEGRYMRSGRLKREAEKQQNYVRRQAEKGKCGAEKRWKKHAGQGHSTSHAPAIAQGMTENSSSSSSSILKKEKNEHPATPVYLNGSRAGFQIFWDAFPKKRNKGKAEQAWLKLKPDEVLLGTMLSKIEQATHTPDWKKEDGKYIPYPASWLNAKGWEDEYTVPSQQKGGLVL